MLSAAERLFNEEVRDKKRTANGVHSKKGKRGYVGTMRFPTDILRGKEKREHKKNGKVVSWNMYRDICDYSYFESLPVKEQKKVLESLRENHKNEEIRKKWGLHNQGYYSLVNKLGVKSKIAAKSRNTQGEKLTAEELILYSKKVISYSAFKRLVTDHQYYLFDIYNSQMNVRELADAWGTHKSNVYSYQAKFKKKLEAGEINPVTIQTHDLFETAEKQKDQIVAEKEVEHEPITADELVETTIEENNDNAEIVENNNEDTPLRAVSKDDREFVSEHVETVHQDSTTSPKSSRSYGTTLSFDGEYTQEQLRKKLLTMVELLEEDGRFYKMNISFTEIQENEHENS